MKFRTILVAVFWSSQVQSIPISVFSPSSCLSFGRECLMPILRDSEAQNLYFVSNSNSTFCPTNITHHGTSTTWMYFDKIEKVQLTFYKPFFCVVASEDVVSMIALLWKFKICHQGKIILMLPSDVSPDFSEMERVFAEAWTLGILDVLIVLSSRLDCFVYSYIPFSPGKCYDKTPVLVNYWKVHSNYTKVHYFPDNKISSLHLCKLVIEHLPFKLSGKFLIYWKPLTDFFTVAMKSSREMRSTNDLNFPLAYSNLTNVIMFECMVNHSYSAVFVFSPIFRNNVGVLAIPLTTIFSFGWFRIVNELSWPVWCSVILSFVVAVLVLFFISNGKSDWVSVAMLSLRPLLGTSIPILPLHGRSFLFSWLLVCFVLSSSYLSLLYSTLTAPFTLHSVNSIDEFLKSDMVILCRYTTFTAMKVLVSGNRRLEPLLNRTIVLTGRYNSVVNRSRNDVAYVIAKDDFYGLFKNMSYRILPEYLITQHNSVLMLGRPSPLERIFILSYLRITEAGVFDFIRARNLRYRARYKRLEPSVVIGPRPLSLNFFASIFVIWSVGCVLACIVFAGEYCYSCYKSSV